VTVEDSGGLPNISAVYLPPKHTVKQEEPWNTGSLQEATTILNILTRDLDLCHPEGAKYSKQYKETT
jgi:hypothetical protein